MNIYAQLEKNTGKKEINNVYIGKDDYLIEKYSERDFDDELQKMNVKNLALFLDACSEELGKSNVTCMFVPSKIDVLRNKLSVLEEDYLKALLTDEASKDTSSEETENQNKKAEGHQKKKKQTPWIVLGCVAAVVVVIAIGAIAYVRYQNNNSYDYQIEMAEKELVDLNYEKALSYYKNALTLSPNDINARAAMAEIYLARKEYDSALVLEMEIINLDKKNKEAYQGLITIYEAKGQYDKITELASTVTDTDLLELFSGYIVAEPVFYPDEGTYDVYTEVTIFSIEECDIYYTLDESDPKKNGILYTDAGIELDDVGKYTIKAVCKNDKGIYSDVVTCKYKTEAKAPDYPEVTPDGGTMDDITFVVITADEGCSIYYTWDGTDPTDTSARYTEPIEVPEGNNILSIIVVNDKTKLTSEIYRTNFIYHAQPGVEIEE